VNFSAPEIRRQLLMLIGVFPVWPHSGNWGYGPSGGRGLVVVILIVLLLMGRI